jgi:hydroxymethylbilane synthase
VVDAAVLAAAGLARQGLAGARGPFGARHDGAALGPRPLALQAENDFPTLTAIAALDHAPSRTALEAERSLMWRLGGGCALPLGALATMVDSRVEMIAVVVSPMAPAWRGQRSPDSPRARWAPPPALIDEGAEEILESSATRMKPLADGSFWSRDARSVDGSLAS